MKIGILTLPIDYNYGGILQAYALQTFLKKQGHEVFIIDRKWGGLPISKICLETLKRIVLRFIYGRRIPVTFHQIRENEEFMCHYTNEFVKEELFPRTVPCYTRRDLKKRLPSFDIYIVGSDQVWRPAYTPQITNYFFDFLKDKKDIKRIAYAASLGVGKWMFSRSQTYKCKELVKKFDAVSVRESSAIDLCRKHLGINPVHVLDPTMLLDKSDYLRLTPVQKEMRCSNALLVYILDSSDQKNALIDRVKSMGNYDLVTEHFFEKIDHKGVSTKVAKPVTCWLDAFARAKFVVTDSFHGCVFSILFNRNFVVYLNEHRGKARILSLLNLFGLKNRIVDSVDTLYTDRMIAEIDWKEVNGLLKEYRKRSIDFLLRSIEE